ncbi:MAG TPA: ferritin-like domain-containing protein [Planktothrix sp.]
MTLTENELWLLSFYRSSEISGALFFGRLAQSIKSGPIQRDMTKHFADESAHAWYWTRAIEQLGGKPLRLRQAYQDQYIEAAGMPVNVMEVLAITQVFEQRVISQYSVHSQVAGLDPVVKETLRTIMEDEKWHIEWIRDALRQMEKTHGEDLVERTMRKFKEADCEVYSHTMTEHGERIREILHANERLHNGAN